MLAPSPGAAWRLGAGIALSRGRCGRRIAAGAGGDAVDLLPPPS
jgi:hypothetical protein